MNFLKRNIKRYVLKDLSMNGLNLAKLKNKYKMDVEVVSTAVKQNVKAIEYADAILKKDEGFIYSLACQNIEVLKYLQNDTAIKVLNKIRIEKNNNINTNKLYNEKMVIDTIEKVKWALNFTSGSVVLDRASDGIKDNKEAVLLCVKNIGQALYHASKRLKNDEDVVLEAVSNDGLSLASASEIRRDDDNIVLEAVKNNGYALRFASDRLRNDKEIVKVACKNEPWAIKNASTQLRNDEDFIFEIAKENEMVITKVPQVIYRKVMKRLQKEKNWENIISIVK